MENMILYSTFEEMYKELEKARIESKLMEFIDPLPAVDEMINTIVADIKGSGKVVFILGEPGIGKSSYLHTLSWKSHIAVRSLSQINSNDFMDDSLSLLYDEIAKFRKDAKARQDKGPTGVVINYLENMAEIDEHYIKAFFRKLNGLLRDSPLLILWPVTDKADVEKMLEYSKDVSKTLFSRKLPVIEFMGPQRDRYKNIVMSTVSVLNDGKDVTQFGVTYDDLVEIDSLINSLPEKDQTLREYIELVKEKYEKVTNRLAQMKSVIPKATEVWFIFSYPDAENMVGEYVRKSERAEDNFTAIHDKFYEYASRGQRASVWDAKRLQLALYGAIKTRVMYLPTNCLLSLVYSFSTNPTLVKLLEDQNIPKTWKDKYGAKKKLETTPLYKTLVGESMPYGKRRGGPAAQALDTSAPIFAELTKWISGSGAGSDKEINKCVKEAISELSGKTVESDKKHPWLTNLIPDIFVDLPHKQVCIEFHYTNQPQSYIISEYCLDKLNTYMNELENYTQEKKSY